MNISLLAKRKQEKVFSDLLYGQCWEDPQIDRQAFKLESEDIVFSITSGGCNVLAFLLDKPKNIIALDFNPRQNFLLELKMAAFRQMEYDDMLKFLGVNSTNRRWNMYMSLRGSIGNSSRSYWDSQPDKIEMGIIHSGRFERYINMLRKWLSILLHKSTIEQLYQTSDPQERRELLQRSWRKISWRVLTGCLLSRRVMTLLFSPAFFAQLEQDFSFGSHFRKRVEYALTELPLSENYFLAYFLKGEFNSRSLLPVYLRQENFLAIRKGLEAIEMVTSSCEEYFRSMPADSFSKFNFTNIFEWMRPKAFADLLRETVRVGKDGAILTYRNLLVPRSRPEALSKYIHPLEAKAAELYCQDLSFIYDAYIVEQIRKDSGDVI